LPIALCVISNRKLAIGNVREWLANPGCSSLEQRRLEKIGACWFVNLSGERHVLLLARFQTHPFDLLTGLFRRAVTSTLLAPSSP
jgi:hypothetical protein